MINEYDHEDAFKAANICAGKYCNLSEVLRTLEGKHPGMSIEAIEECKIVYEKLFHAFIEGVDYARKNSSCEKEKQ